MIKNRSIDSTRAISNRPRQETFFEFLIEEVEDRTTSNPTDGSNDIKAHKIKAVYLKNMPKWQGYDLVGEIPEINYQVFGNTVEFLLNYYKTQNYNFDFQNHQEAATSKNNKMKWCSSI